jgi:hypothetical protein
MLSIAVSINGETTCATLRLTFPTGSPASAKADATPLEKSEPEDTRVDDCTNASPIELRINLFAPIKTHLYSIKPPVLLEGTIEFITEDTIFHSPLMNSKSIV